MRNLHWVVVGCLVAHASYANDEARPFGLRADPLPAMGLRSDAPAPGLKNSASRSGVREGWTTFGAFGPMRFVQPLQEDASMAMRLGGRPPGMPTREESGALPRNLNFGLQYRF